MNSWAEVNLTFGYDVNYDVNFLLFLLARIFYNLAIMIIEGRLYDEGLDKWLEFTDYASRSPKE